MHAQLPSQRVVYSALVFIVCCLLSSARLMWHAAQDQDPNLVAARSDLRFAALKAQLPERGTVGYVGKTDPAALGDYYLAQYALAPLVVEHTPNHALVVGNFPHGGPSQPFENLQLVRDFGNGVLLLANKDFR